MTHYLILRVIAKLMIGPIMLFALYVQFHGDFGPGGGFQAGVIFAAALILYGLVFDLTALRRFASLELLCSVMALGWLLYIGVGFATMLLGGRFLDYDFLAADPVAGQHIGILLIELGVGITVAATMLIIFEVYAGRKMAAEGEGGA